MITIKSLTEKVRLRIAAVIRRSRHDEKKLLNVIEYLWQIIDDIDTASDMAKSNDKTYRKIVERKQKLRWKTGINTDGYTLDLSGIKENEIKAWL